MKNFIKFCFISILVTGMFIYAGCGGDSGGGTSNFGTQAEATAAVTDLNNQGFFDQIQGDVDDAVNQATGFTPGYFKSSKTKRKLSKVYGAQNFIYNSSDGFWTYAFDTTYTESYSGYTYDNMFDYLYKIRFTPRDQPTGFPTDNTDKMEWISNYDMSLDGSGDGSTSSSDFSYGSDMDVTGIAAYNATTGDLTINGNGHLDMDISASSAGTTVEYGYHTSHDFNALTLTPEGSYPQSGTISFTAKRNVSPSQLEEYYPNFNVAGSITYNGTSTAILVIGGFTFNINLITGVITPVS